MDLINLKIYKIYHSKQQLFMLLAKNLRAKFVVLPSETKLLTRAPKVFHTLFHSFLTRCWVVPDFARTPCREKYPKKEVGTSI
jgi:hypothetical protein